MQSANTILNFRRGGGHFLSLLLLALLVFSGMASPVLGQLPPRDVRVEAEGNNNRLTWVDGGNDGATVFIRYEIGRSTTRGGAYAVIGNSTTLTYLDTTSATGTAYFYVVRDVYNTGTTAWSEEILRFWPIDGATADSQTLWNEYTVWARWPIYDNEIVKTFVGLGTEPSQGNIVDFIDVGHATEHTFSGVSLVPGQKYFVTVKVQNSRGYLNAYGTSISSSDGFTVDTVPNLTDTASSTGFNNALSRVMTGINANDVTSPMFSNDGGAVWRYRAPLTVTEPGVEARFNAPCEFSITRPTGEVAVNRWDEELRVADEWGNEARVVVNSQTSGGGNNNATATLIVNLPRGGSRVYWVHWGNPSATVPAYGFVNSSNDTSQRAFSRYYSRKLLPPGVENWAQSVYTSCWGAGGFLDDTGVWLALPWTFNFFGTNRTNLYFSTNSHLSVTNGFNTYTNTFTKFTGSNLAGADHNGMIAAIWCDTMTRDATPQNAGQYTYRADSGQPTDRWIAYSRDNRYNKVDDIYIHQMVLYQRGDIALRYEYLSTGALYDDAVGTDNPLNSSTIGGSVQPTSGISNYDNSNYFWTTPLIEGIGQCPTSYFQYMKTCSYTLGAVEDAGAGWSFAGHFDSRVFDSRSATPNWTNLTYTITPGTGRFTIYTRTGATPTPDGIWSPWLAVATNVTVSASPAIASPERRYLQYRCVFQKPNAASNPRLDDISLSCGRLKVQTVTASTSAGISQGQDNIPVQVSLINESPGPITVTQLSLGFSLGSYTSTLVTPTLPVVLNAGVATSATFSVNVWDDSPVGPATIHALATGTAAGPVTYADIDADVPHVWQVLRKAELSIAAVTAVPTTVNKGQSVPVQLTISNLGEVPCTLDAASLTFSLGSYTQLLTAPPLGTIIPASGTIYASLSVTVLPISPSGVAILNANASGTNTYTSKKTEDSDSDIPDSWTIQNPAEFLLETILASDTVFRGQTGVLLQLTVRNLGEALGKWESSTILPYFTVGTYDAVTPTTVFPVSVYGGLATTARYAVDISPLSATGTSDIDARVDGSDGNDGFPISDEFAAFPASWTIVGEKLKTYKDPAFFFESASFNRPFAGTLEVYCRAENLAPLKEFAVRWYNPVGTLVLFTNPPLTSDASGTLMHQFSLTSTSPFGNWTVKVTDPLDTFTACLTSFQVVSPASLSVSLALPAAVTVGQSFIGSMTFSNIGGAEVESAYPSILATGGTGLATLISGPTPLTQDVPGLGTGTFTWNWTAVNPGTFLATGSGLGFDGNSDAFIKSATVTSNICTIQTAPVVSVASISESYTNVYLNQSGLTVLMGIRNTGQAPLIVTAASLTFSVGTHFQTLASPTLLPFRLNGNSAATFTFDVAVASTSLTGAVTISGSFIGYDFNNPAAIYSATGGNGAWTINSVQGICADNSDYNPEQYSFTKNQTVFARFIYLPLNTYFRIRFFNAETGGTQVKVSPRLYSGALGLVDDLWTLLSTDANTLPRKWRVSIDEDADNNNTTVGTIFGVQYFQVQNPPQLVATLTLSPTRVFVGEPITATLIATNTVATSATVAPATPSSLIKTTLSTGDLGFVSGPDPALTSIPSLASGVYSWSFVASADTGVVGSLSMMASLTSSVFGVDSNNEAATNSNRAVSNPIYIYRRAISVASNTIDSGSLKPGDIGPILTFRVDNPANYQLLAVNWNPTDINGPGVNKISKANLKFASDPLGAIGTASNRLASSVLTIPYNQASGTYIATMSVYEDLNGNLSQDFTEPYDLFNVKVVVPLAKVIIRSDAYIDLGDWSPGQTTNPVGFSIFNGGNLDLDHLKIRPLVGSAAFITVAPADPGSLSIGLTVAASASAIVPGAAASGIYIATWTLFEDENGNGSVDDPVEGSATIRIRIGIGNKAFTVAPATLNAGIATPTLVIFGLQEGVQNTGPLPLTHLTAAFQPLTDGLGNFIASDSLAYFAPGAIPIASSATGTVNFYSPAGTPVGVYNGLQWIYEDNNGNGVWNPGEASASFQFTVTVPPYEAVQVLWSTVDMGDLAPGTGNTVSFACRNIGNQLLNQLRWEKVNLLDGAKTLASSAYDFPPAVPFTASPGVFFNRDLTINVPLGQSDGSYLGSSAWLFEDNDVNTLRGGTEPQDNFFLTCRIGTLSVDILEATLTSSGDPFATSTAAAFNVKNTGSLTLARIKATGTALLGPQTIPATASVFIPVNLGSLVSTQSRSGTWQVAIPANTLPGVYNGMMTVWNDSDNDNIMDAPEASATANLQLTVNSKRVIFVVQDPLDLGWTTENSVATGQLEIRNVGNQNLTGVRLVASEVRNLAADVIPAGNITFIPVNVGPLAIGAATLATVSVTVGSPQSNGVYTGNQRAFDDYNVVDTAWNPLEEFDLFQLRLSIGKKQLAVTPAISYGAVNPGGTYPHTPPFSVTNLTAIPLTKLKWNKGNLTDGVNTIPAASQTFAPAGPFSISGSGLLNINGQLTVASFFPAGTYIGTHTVWEDDNNDGTTQNNEASGTFTTTVTVNAISTFDLLPATIDFGKVARNTPSAWISFGLRNTGNVNLTNFVWTFQPLSGPGPDPIPAASISYSGVYVPDPVLPGQYSTGTVKIETIGATQTLGIHSGAPQTLAGSGGSFDSCAFTVDILPGGPNTASGTVFQEVATSTFTTASPNNRYLLSAWVCPGTQTACLGFLQTTNSGQSLVNLDSIQVTTSGMSTKTGSNLVEAGVSERRQVLLPTGETSFWQRVYVAFDYSFDPGTASETWVILQNLSATTTASATVWFDGVQLEKATFPNQTRPTTFDPGEKIISPNQNLEMDGTRRMYEW